MMCNWSNYTFIKLIKVLYSFLGLTLLCYLSFLCPTYAKDNIINFNPVGVPKEISITGTEAVSDGKVLYRYYSVGHKLESNKPIVIFVPGSGCDGAFHLGSNGHANGGVEIFALPFINKINNFVLEPIGMPRQFSSPTHGVSEGCPDDFLKRNDFSDIILAYQAAVDNIIKKYAKKNLHIMLVGMSDGVLMAAELAHRYHQVDHLVLISGFGVSQVNGQTYDLLKSVFEEGDQKNANIRMESYLANLKIISKKSYSTNLWQGQPYTRWASTARYSSAEIVSSLPSYIELLLVQGGMDTNWPLDNFLQGLAILLSNGSNVAVKYLACGDHYLECTQGSSNSENLELTIHEAINWFISGEYGPSWHLFR